MIRSRLSAQDALWLTMDRPTNLMVIDVAVVLGGTVDAERLTGMFADLVTRHPVFGCRAERSGLGWAWVDDPDFDPAQHLSVVDLPDGADMADVEAYVGRQRSVPLPRDRPLWSATLLRPVVLDDGASGSVVLTRLHHAIADGVRLTQVMLGMLDPGFADSVPRISRRAPGHPSPTSVDDLRRAAAEVSRVTTGTARTVVGAVGHVVANPVRAVTSATGALVSGVGSLRHPDRFVDALEVLGADDHRMVNDMTSASKLVMGASDRTVWTGRPGTTKAVAWSAPLPLEPVRQLARSRRATLNDVLIAALAGALRTYLTGRGDEVDQVVWMVPVNLEPFSGDLPEELGNHFALVMLDLPLTGQTPARRLRDVRQRMQRIKNSDEPILTFGIQRAIAASPGRMATVLTDFFANKAVGVLTNVPGPTRAMHVDGVEVRQVIGFAPCSGDQPLTATIFTYAGTVTVGFASDTDLVPDPQTLVDLVQEELRALGADVG